jgi:hypothetical protein
VYTATYPGRIRALIIVDSTLRMPEERVAMLRNVGNRLGADMPPMKSFSPATGFVLTGRPPPRRSFAISPNVVADNSRWHLDA